MFSRIIGELFLTQVTFKVFITKKEFYHIVFY